MRDEISIAVWSCAASAVLAFATVLTGCGAGEQTLANSTGAANPSAFTEGTLRGKVMGGQQPVAGVTLQLYQAGTTGYGSAAIPLGPTSMTTANGNFNLPSYSCAAGSQVYLVGTGGQPIAGVTNSNLALMVGLGTCGGSYLNSFINVNELTTVATVWALSPFMVGPANIGASSTNTAGLANAFAAINELVTTANGTMPGPTLPAGTTLPTNEINTLADILEQCINSSGGVAGDGSNCGNLFNLAPNAAGSVYPTDTITAAMYIAQNPSRNVANLNKLRSASPAFQPAFNVNSPPNAWTLAITYTGGGTLSSPEAIATDASGNVWVTNPGNASVTQLDGTGALVFNSTAGGFNNPNAIAIDANGYAWVTNAGNNTVIKLAPSGSFGTSYSGNGLNIPTGIAINGDGDVWVANSGSNQVTVFTSSGGVLSGSPFTSAGVTAPVTVAVTPK